MVCPKKGALSYPLVSGYLIQPGTARLFKFFHDTVP
jgi:hypothetical protein